MRKYLFIISVICVSLSMSGQYYNNPDNNAKATDTVMVYNSWDAIFSGVPDTIIVNPSFEIRSPFDFDFKSSVKGDKTTGKMLKEQTIAVAIGDTTWLMSSNYLKREFKGEAKYFSRFVPMYFSEKVVFVQWARLTRNFGDALLDILVGGLDETNFYDDIIFNNAAVPFYYLDFSGKTVYKVDHNLLSELLSDYPYLQRRYEQMHDYKETYMVNQFFLDWVRLIDTDDDYPYLDL